MGFFSHKRKYVAVQPEQKWDFISLNDFKSTNCFTPFAYGYLWFSLLLSVTVYAVDTFTAYQLLAFNSWSSQVEPTQLIPFEVSKWIFSVCIILSFLNLAYEHIRAQKVIRRGSVAESFLDNLAVRLESIRMGRGRGYKRFLVFAELTKSKKGSEVVALFAYFSFQAWVRIIVCSGPRQVVNALTLYSVYIARLSVKDQNFESSLTSFFDKIKALADEDYRQALILSGMLYTLIIWLFAFLSLLIAALMFVFYLWHIIPRDDGGLTGFCERKINKRLKQIVSIKINKAMADEERKKRKAEIKAAKKNGEDRPITMQPSLPTIPNVSGGGEDKLPEMPMLSRAETFMTLDEKARPNTPGSFELGAMGRPGPKRTATMATTATSASYSSHSGLLNNAAQIGMSRPESPAPSLPTPTGYSASIAPSRTGTMASNRSYGQGPGLNRMASNGSSLQSGYAAGPGLNRMASNGSSLQREYSASPAPFSSEPMPAFPPPVRSPTAPAGYSGPGPNQGYSQGRAPYGDYPSGRASPAPSNQPYGPGPLSPRGPEAYPVRSATGPIPPRGPPQRFAPQRNMTAPVQPTYGHQQTPSNGSLRNMVSSPARPYHGSQSSMDYSNRPPTANSQRSGSRSQPYQQGPSGGDYDEYFNPPPPSNSQRPDARGGQPYSQPQGNGEFDWFDTPETLNQRGPPGGGGGGGNGWNHDIERGNGPRY